MSLAIDVTVAITIIMVSILDMDVKVVTVLKHQMTHNVTIIRDNVHASRVSPENIAIDACPATGTTARMGVNVSS